MIRLKDVKMKIAMSDPPGVDGCDCQCRNTIDHINICKGKGRISLYFPEIALTGYFVGLGYHGSGIDYSSPRSGALPPPQGHGRRGGVY